MCNFSVLCSVRFSVESDAQSQTVTKGNPGLPYQRLTSSKFSWKVHIAVGKLDFSIFNLIFPTLVLSFQLRSASAMSRPSLIFSLNKSDIWSSIDSEILHVVEWGVGKIELLESFMLESLKLKSFNSSWKVMNKNQREFVRITAAQLP